eukprot:2096288-Prorocentrum_lima.AAC.1
MYDWRSVNVDLNVDVCRDATCMCIQLQLCKGTTEISCATHLDEQGVQALAERGAIFEDGHQFNVEID